MIPDDLGEPVKMVAESRDHVQRSAQHKPGPRADPHYGEMNHGCRHVGGRGGMVGWDGAEGAGVREDLGVLLE